MKNKTLLGLALMHCGQVITHRHGQFNTPFVTVFGEAAGGCLKMQYFTSAFKLPLENDDVENIRL